MQITKIQNCICIIAFTWHTFPSTWGPLCVSCNESCNSLPIKVFMWSNHLKRTTLPSKPSTGSHAFYDLSVPWWVWLTFHGQCSSLQIKHQLFFLSNISSFSDNFKTASHNFWFHYICHAILPFHFFVFLDYKPKVKFSCILFVLFSVWSIALRFWQLTATKEIFIKEIYYITFNRYVIAKGVKPLRNNWLPLCYTKYYFSLTTFWRTSVTQHAQSPF